MPQNIQVGKVAGQTYSPVKAWAYPNAQTFKIGAAMILSANKAQEAGATPTTNILGFAAQPVDSNLGFGAANSPTQVTGRNQTVSILTANSETVFRGSLVNASAVVVAPAITDVGVKYGLSSQGGVWCVDKALTGASAAVQVVDYDTSTSDGGFVYFKVLVAALALP